jgi:hypothetical protein
LPSPFLGIDPFFGTSEFFPDFRDRFVSYANEFLQPHMLQRYSAASGRRAGVETLDRQLAECLRGA